MVWPGRVDDPNLRAPAPGPRGWLGNFHHGSPCGGESQNPSLCSGDGSVVQIRDLRTRRQNVGRLVPKARPIDGSALTLRPAGRRRM